MRHIIRHSRYAETAEEFTQIGGDLIIACYAVGVVGLDLDTHGNDRRLHLRALMSWNDLAILLRIVPALTFIASVSLLMFVPTGSRR
jgi:hypothetical protein